MGCATSSVSPHGSAADVETKAGGDTGERRSQPIGNGHAAAKGPQPAHGTPRRAVGAAAATSDGGDVAMSAKSPVPKGTSFEVPTAGEDSIIKRHPPKRLMKLEALEKSQITAEELAEKLRAADEKRQRTLESRAKTASASRRSSKRARELLAAKEFEKQHQQTEEIGKKQASAGKQREMQQQIAAERLRVREEKARLAAERRKRMERDEELLVDYELERDENFNDQDGDDEIHWSGTDDLRPYEPDGDNVYMGRDSPKKGVREPRALEPRHSASTVDSCDTDYKRTQASVAALAAASRLRSGVHRGDQDDCDDDAGFYD